MEIWRYGTVLLALLATSAAAVAASETFNTPADIAVPIRDYVYIERDVPLECTPERLSWLRWRADHTLEICTGEVWMAIEVTPDEPS